MYSSRVSVSAARCRKKRFRCISLRGTFTAASTRSATVSLFITSPFSTVYLFAPEAIRENLRQTLIYIILDLGRAPPEVHGFAGTTQEDRLRRRHRNSADRKAVHEHAFTTFAAPSPCTKRRHRLLLCAQAASSSARHFERRLFLCARWHRRSRAVLA